jgi:hypothetical protein
MAIACACKVFSGFSSRGFMTDLAEVQASGLVSNSAHFNSLSDAAERISYMAPNLVGPEKAARGKRLTDCYSADTQILTRRGWLPFPSWKTVMRSRRFRRLVS